MTAMPLDPFDPPEPTRPRAGLVPLPVEELLDPWRLGATGTLAHRPARHDPLLRLMTRHDDLAPDHAVCGVMVTRLPAGPAVQRCGLCHALAGQAEPAEGR